MVIVLIIVTISLFAPSSLYNPVFILNFGLLTFGLIQNRRKLGDVRMMSLTLLIGVIALCLKLFLFQSFEDVKWYLRLIFFVNCIFYLKTIDHDKVKYIYVLLGIYTAISLGLSIMEIQKMHANPILVFLRTNYWSEVHRDVIYRSKALNAGPGQYALRITLINLLFGHKILTRKFKLWHVLVFLSTIVMVVFTSSRTGLVTVLISTATVLMLSKNRLLSLAALAYIPFLGIYDNFYFARVMRFMDDGVAGDSSAVSRYENWGVLFGQALKYPVMFLTGWSENIFPEFGDSTDNELITIFLYYGLLGFTAFLFFQVNLIRQLIKESVTLRHSLYFGMLLIVMIMSQMFTYFFTDYITIIVIVMISKEHDIFVKDYKATKEEAKPETTKPAS